MRYKLRTLLILLAILPPLLWIGWTKYAAWKAEQERRALEARMNAIDRYILRRLQTIGFQVEDPEPAGLTELHLEAIAGPAPEPAK